MLPTPDDDADEQVAAQAEEADGEETAQKPATTQEDVPADPRARIAQRYRESRDAKEREEAEEEASAEADATDETGTADAADEDAAPGPQSRKYKLKVDGEERELTLDEIIPLAQKGAAGDSRLESSKELITVLKGLSAQLTANQRGAVGSDKSDSDAAESEDPKAQERAEARAVKLDKLKARVERIQVGDVDEGAAALAEVIDELGEEFGGLPQDFDARVDERVAKQQVAAEIKSAVGEFRTRYPEIVKDEDVREVTLNAARDEMIKDWLAAGASEEEVKPWRNKPPALVAEFHQNMKVKGLDGIRPYNEILDAAAQRIGTKFNLLKQEVAPPANDKGPRRVEVSPAEAQRRVEAKRSMQQPKTAGGRGQPAQGQKRPKSTIDIVREMRKHRNFTVSS